MLLITSVPPVFSRKDRKTGEELGTRYLASCIDSWRKNGFQPLSINRFDEVDAINRLGLIDCLGVSNDEAYFPNRFGPSLGAILDTVSSAEAVGIVNADIYMLSAEGCAEILAQQSQKSIVAARRMDVMDHGASRGNVFELGYDLVAFTPESPQDYLERSHTSLPTRCSVVGLCISIFLFRRGACLQNKGTVSDAFVTFGPLE